MANRWSRSTCLQYLGRWLVLACVTFAGSNRVRIVLYLTSHPGQLSLAIPPRIGAMSTSESSEVNSMLRDTPLGQYSWSCNKIWCLADGYKNRDHTLPHGPVWLGEDFFYKRSTYSRTNLGLTLTLTVTEV